MDFTALSRLEFGLTIGFHYLFALSTLGLTLYILAFESVHVLKNDDASRRISDFLTRLLAVVFVFGVGTGFMMPFAFGGNWARFSQFSGSVFGIQLVLEAITAFALEAVSLGVLLYGRNKVSRKTYWAFAFLVFLGAHLSGFWIVSANSWMQTPAGFAVEDGRAVLTSFYGAVFSPTAVLRFLHVTMGAWIAGTMLVAGISAYHLLKNAEDLLFRRLLKISVAHLIVFTALQAGIGHAHILKLIEHNPLKDAAYEGTFQTVRGATLYAFGIPDAKDRKIHFGIGMPYMLSFLESGSFMSETKGLDQFPEEAWPPVNVIFTTFHLMAMLGGVMLLVGVAGGYLLWKKNLFQQRWYLLVLLYAIPLPYLANELGWVGTEMGRQPWIIYEVMRTDQASTLSLPASHAAISLSFIVIFYSVLSVLFMKHFIAAVRKGPSGPVGEALTWAR